MPAGGTCIDETLVVQSRSSKKGHNPKVSTKIEQAVSSFIGARGTHSPSQHAWSWVVSLYDKTSIYENILCGQGASEKGNEAATSKVLLQYQKSMAHYREMVCGVSQFLGSLGYIQFAGSWHAASVLRCSRAVNWKAQAALHITTR